MKNGVTSDLVEMLQILIGDDPVRRARIDSIKRRLRLAQRLYAMRQQRGVTQAEFASQLGISKSTVARIERGDVDSLSLATIEKIVLASGLEFHWEVREPRKAKAA